MKLLPEGLTELLVPSVMPPALSPRPPPSLVFDLLMEDPVLKLLAPEPPDDTELPLMPLWVVPMPL
jgi:hypothetical protein